ncbi:MAG: prepilin-type N-terminal cleavage/methylation domain-containing protein [Candidatus Riflebacteria bacterium]|nr:prepilin-type N-terminal cleavage/methylation domain-containing protein [Candidatus Riflebacteria bacterium]
MSKKIGFTLIELLVVITILAILVGAALPFVQNYVQESRISKAKADLDEISRALMVYETREGTYNSSNISQIVGRYLNNSPVDPWGVQYFVATESGIVYSSGPDRIPLNYDDISAGYQPPLALVNVKWVDANNTGAVDTQNRPDYLLLQFSRKISATDSQVLQNKGGAHVYFSCTSSDTVENMFAWENLKLDNSGSMITLPLATGVVNAFVAGSDTFCVSEGDGFGLRDLASTTANPGGNRCISSQTVVIMSSK